MSKAQDFTQTMKGFMGAFPADPMAFQDAFKNQAALGEKLSAVMLGATEKAADISGKWTKDTLASLSEVAKVKDDPADYAKAVADFATASAETAAENFAAYAEIAKRAQLDSVELVMSAGKDIQDNASEAVRKATDGVAAAVAIGKVVKNG